ncbi:MAG: glutathione S-transferase [Gallionella sp.]
MLPVLYSFRRCPYAMRARLALQASGIAYELREVSLRDKPDCMLCASPKGSVPVLILPDGRVIDESWDIMQWALQLHDPMDWLGENRELFHAAKPLVAENDTTFKHYLDRYKYPQRFPEQTQADYRAHAELFLQKLEPRLKESAFLLGRAFSIADAALFPFVRQFSSIDKDWFADAPYRSLRRWLETMSTLALVTSIMVKYRPWKLDDPPIFINNVIDESPATFHA